MDWKRVKTILIIAMIGVNIMLALDLYEDNKHEITETLDQTLLLQFLEDNNIILDEKLLDIKKSIPNVSLVLQSYDLDFCKEVFEKNNVFSKSGVINLETTIDQSEALSFKTYYDRFEKPNLTDDDTLRLSYQLLSDLKLSLDDIELLEIGRTGEKTILIFGQKIGSYMVKDSYMTIKYNNANLLEFNRFWFDVVEVDPIKKTFFNPEYAIFDFVGQAYKRFPSRVKKLEVSGIELVYQLKPLSEVDSLDNLAKEGDASIYWEITTSDKEVYLVNPISSRK